MRHPPKSELIDCHDCGGAISFRAAACPHCGSREPSGPYIFSREDLRLFRIEERNDRTLAVTTLACGAVGALYGLVMSSGPTGAIIGGAIGAGVVGLIVGVPIGFAIIFTAWLIGE